MARWTGWQITCLGSVVSKQKISIAGNCPIWSELHTLHRAELVTQHFKTQCMAQTGRESGRVCNLILCLYPGGGLVSYSVKQVE